MTITLSAADYEALWQVQPLAVDPTANDDFVEVRRTVSARLGQGYKQSIQWGGVDVTVFNYQFHEDVHVRYPSAEEAPEIVGEIGFHLSGHRHGYRTGENFVRWGQCEDEDEWTAVTYAKEPVFKVDIHLEASSALVPFIADTLETLPTEICQHIEGGLVGSSKSWLTETNRITPKMRLPLEQILNCPFYGRTKQIYVEGKCLELMALKLEQLKDIDKRTRPSYELKSDDVDRIHYAKVILKENLDNPPSLIELARQINLNDHKLKVGFRQVFGTTVFGYLHQYRMETARQLLNEQRLTVKQVARAVGYANPSRFAAAFRKRFGLNPKAYLSSKK